MKPYNDNAEGAERVANLYADYAQMLKMESMGKDKTMRMAIPENSVLGLGMIPGETIDLPDPECADAYNRVNNPIHLVRWQVKTYKKWGNLTLRKMDAEPGRVYPRYQVKTGADTKRNWGYLSWQRTMLEAKGRWCAKNTAE